MKFQLYKKKIKKIEFYFIKKKKMYIIQIIFIKRNKLLKKI